MKVLGLITEYNPFHNGHLYHLNLAKEITKADYTLCVMSGNFVQRGEPAIVNKWTRAESAVRAGVDLVIELPTVYCCQTAELFALGSIKILNSLNIVDYLVFGSELGDIKALSLIAKEILQESSVYKRVLKAELSNGLPFFIAREHALKESLVEQRGLDPQDLPNILSKSNNILGIEYLKAMITTNSSITPLTIERIKAEYNSKELIGTIASATAIREHIKKEGITELISDFMPRDSYQLLHREFNAGRGPVFIDDYLDIILYLIRLQGKSLLTKIIDVNEGLDNKIFKAAIKSNSIDSLVSAVKSKRYPRTRLNRILCHCLLGLHSNDVLYFKNYPTPQAIRVLGFSEKGKELLRMISQRTTLPIVTKIAPYIKQSRNIPCQISLDSKATDVYALGYENKDYRISGLDLTTSPYFRM